MDTLTILKSHRVKDGIIFVTKQNPEIEINIGNRPAHRLTLSHFKLAFSNLLAIDGDSQDASLDFVFEKKVGAEIKHKLYFSILLKQTSNIKQEDSLSFIAPNSLFWDQLGNVNNDFNVETNVLNNILPDEKQHEGIYFIEKSDSVQNACNSRIMSYQILKTPVLVVNDLKKLKKLFNLDLNLFNKPPFELISEVSIVRMNISNKALLPADQKLQEDQRKNVTEKEYAPKDKFGFMRFKSRVHNNNEVDLETYLHKGGALKLNESDRKVNFMNTGRQKYIPDAFKVQKHFKHAPAKSTQKEFDSILRFKQKDNLKATNTNDDTIVEPDNESDIKNYKIFEQNDEKKNREDALKVLRMKSRKLRHKQVPTLQKKDWSKINSLVDIKNMRFKESSGALAAQADQEHEVDGYAPQGQPREITFNPGAVSLRGHFSKTKGSGRQARSLKHSPTARYEHETKSVDTNTNTNTNTNTPIPDEPTVDQGTKYFEAVTKQAIEPNTPEEHPDSNDNSSNSNNNGSNSSNSDNENVLSSQSLAEPDQSQTPDQRFSQERQNQETDSHMDSGLNGTIDYKNNMNQLDHIKDREKKLDDIYSNESNLSKLKTRKLPPKGLLANFKLSTAINPNGSISVELNQFKSSLENIYNKGYADALEDLGMDPRNAQDPKTQDAQNYLRDINHNKRDQIDFTKNFRFKESSSRFANKKNPSMTKADDDSAFSDEIYDPKALELANQKNNEQRAVIAAQTKYKINPKKKDDLLHVKDNIIQLGHQLKDNNVTQGPLQDLFNNMYDNQSHLLTNFERKNKSILNSMNESKALRFNQTQSENQNTSSDSPTSPDSKKKDEIDLDKWHQIKARLDAPKFADFNMQDVNGQSLLKKQQNLQSKNRLVGKGVLDLSNATGVFDGASIGKNDFKALKSTYKQLFNNLKSSQQKQDPKADQQVNMYKVGFRQKKPELKLNNEFNFQNIPKLTKLNVSLTEAEIDKALRDSDQINIGSNVENDNIFRRGKLQNDKDTFTTVVTPSVEYTHPNMDWKNAHIKLANGYYKYHNPVHNQVEDFGYNKPQQNWNEYDDVETTSK